MASNYDSSYLVCSLCITPYVQSHNGKYRKRDYAKSVFHAFKRKTDSFEKDLKQKAKKDCKPAGIELRYEDGDYFECICRFESVEQEKKFEQHMNDQKLSKIISSFGESIGVASDFRLYKWEKLIIEVMIWKSSPIYQREKTARPVEMQTMIRQETENMSGTDNQNSQEPMLHKFITIYTSYKKEEISHFGIWFKGEFIILDHLNGTRLWQARIKHHLEEDVKFSVEMEHVKPGWIPLTYFESLTTSKSSVISESNFVPHIFLHFPESENIKNIKPEALCEICSYIIHNESFANQKEGIMQLETLTSKTNLPYNMSIRFNNVTSQDTKPIIASIQKNIHICKQNAMAFCYFLSLIARDRTILSEYGVVERENAETVICSLKDLKEGMLPSTCIKMIGRVIPHMARIVYKEETSVLLLIDLMYEGLGDEICLEMMDDALGTKFKNLPLYIETLKFSYIDLLARLFTSASSRKHTIGLTDKMIRFLPLEQHFALLGVETVKCLNDDAVQKIANSLRTKTRTELISFGKNGNFESIFKLWDLVRNVLTPSNNSNETFENSIIDALSMYANYSSFNYTKQLLEILKDESMFCLPDQGLRLVSVLADSKNPDFHQMLIAILNLHKVLALEQDKVGIKLEKIVSVAKTCCPKSPENDILKTYNCLCSLTGTLYLQKFTNVAIVLDTYVLKLLQKHSFKTMIQAISEIEKHDELKAKYSEHLQKILRDGNVGKKPNDVIYDICGAQTLRVNSRVTADILFTILELMKFSENESFENIFANILESRKFWIHILNASGTKSDELKSHPVVKIAAKAIQQTAVVLLDQTISCQYLLFLQGKKEALKEIMSISNDFTKIEKAMHRCSQTLHVYQENLKIIETTCFRLKEHQVWKLKSTMKEVIEYLSLRTKQVSQGYLTIDEFHKSTSDFDRVENISAHCKQIQCAIDSAIFWNIVKCHFDKYDAIFEKEVEKSDVLDEISLPVPFAEVKTDICLHKTSTLKHVLTVVELIGRDCIQQYKQLWQDYKDEKDQQILDTEKFIRGIEDMEKEIEMAENICNVTLSDAFRNSLIRFSNIRLYTETIDTIKIAAHAFNFANQHDSTYIKAVAKFENILNRDLNGVTLMELTPLLEEINSIHGVISEEIREILQALEKSSALLDFLRDVINEDIRNLIDAVEEHSEQYVRESTVSDLIEIKRFFQPLLKEDFTRNIAGLFEMLTKQVKQSGIMKVPEKLFICRDNLHSLIALYKNVANRGERTIEVIEHVNEKGVFQFSLHHKICSITVEYDHEEKRFKHTGADLSDLRSRALLIMNAEEKDKDKKSERKQQLENFIHIVDDSFEVVVLLMRLKEAGHFDYSAYDETCQKDEMSLLKSKLQVQYEGWISEITKCREKYYYINFLYSDQLYELYRYLHKDKKNRGNVIAILKFINPSIENLELITEIYNNLLVPKSHRDILENIGKTLDSLFSGLSIPNISVLGDQRTIKLMDKVQPGKPYITSLDEKSPLVIRTLLGLYLNTTNRFPEAHQVLFCRKDTTFDEISLLLQRCLQRTEELQNKVLFSIANIEKLQGEVQFRLHDEIRKLPPGNFLLCFVCRGQENHSFLDQFSDLLSKPPPISEKKLKECFQKHWPNVIVISSNVPGLGKSEFIQSKAIKDRSQTAYIHISGPVNRLSIVEGLMQLHIKEYQSLHIDIGSVSDPLELDLFLFELIVLKYVSVGSTAYALMTDKVYIEISNTVSDTLRDSLPTVTCFQRKHIEWDGYNDLKISSEINSPMQVVCHYLKALDEGKLDMTDLYFTGPKAVKPLSFTECRSLLRLHFTTQMDMSYTIVNVFLRILADQLKKLSSSVFFRTETLKAMLGKDQSFSVKSNLVKALIDTSKEFSARSVHSCRSTQAATLVNEHCEVDTSEILATRISGMIRWEDSNHLVILFHQNVQTVSALYRKLKNVPKSIVDLFESQVNSKLIDFEKKSSEDLEEILLLLSRKSSTPVSKDMMKKLRMDYALTPDNLLKMVLVSLRINTKLPVLIMGETGCGKTSLIRYLANVCGVTFEVFAVHAGIDDIQINAKLKEVSNNAMKSLKEQYWLFLDEINTCDHIGIITNALCHRKCQGVELPPNLILLAACNPYRLRKSKAIMTAGLQGQKIKSDELSRLVYRVHPLPETLIDHVWDYGNLSKKDEKSYILKMVLAFFEERWFTPLLTELLVMSQHFVRETESNEYCVSLRDVDRCRRLVKWFDSFLEKKKIFCSRERAFRAIILGLAVCYHSRIPDVLIRRKYRQEISTLAKLHYGSITDSGISDIILTEQQDILKRMSLPEGTAMNAALEENVFMLLVCILNKIPIFLVGKPGCSKSLSMQLIRSNLRGKDSTDDLFQGMPQLFCVSFQGSESSTSDGIIKVFEKAEKYQKYNDEKDVLSVVILDEIGLAEISRFNPLKVLHGLIEPGDGKDLKLAVVGISNWALDAAKMNRAIHLSRPDMDLDELIHTGRSISSSMIQKKPEGKHLGNLQFPTTPNIYGHEAIEELLDGIAKGYHDYCSQDQGFQHFHGLRDFYSLVKYIGRKQENIGNADDEELSKIILMGILRNFGGLPTRQEHIINTFKKYIPQIKHTQISVTKLIRENIKDKSCRHLMLITNGDAVISFLEKQLTDMKLPFETIFGSTFEDDLNDDYNYRILSRIILCMEQGMVLILKDLDSIYGSLYDMLNQNYTIVGKKKNCRVALGHYSNPMCHVHDDFKCIVLVDEAKLDYSDPPFLNRFEKQQFEFSHLIELENFQAELDELSSTIADFCQIPEHKFLPEDIIPSYSQDLIVSLVIHSIQAFGTDANPQKVKKYVFEQLLWLLPPEVVIRGKESKLSEKLPAFIAEIIDNYLALPVHSGIRHFLLSYTNTENVKDVTKKRLFVVYTYAGIHSNIEGQFGEKSVQREKLAVFKSEKHFSAQVEAFFYSDSEIFFLQCIAANESQHILLAKVIIEKHMRRFTQDKDCPSQNEKCVCMVIHLERLSHHEVPFNFLSGWKLFFLDSLKEPISALTHFYKRDRIEIVKDRDVKKCINECLFWALSRIHFTSRGTSLEKIEDILRKMQLCPFATDIFEKIILSTIEKNTNYSDSNNWCSFVAKDSHELIKSGTFIGALENNIIEVIKVPLAMYLYQIMQLSLLTPVFVDDNCTDGRRKDWMAIVMSEKYLTIQNIPVPSGPECYLCDTDFLDLRMPCSQIIMKAIDAHKNEFLDIIRQLRIQNDIDPDDDLPVDLFRDACYGCTDIICYDAIDVISAVKYDERSHDYVHDFCNVHSSLIMESMTAEHRISVFKWALNNFLNIPELINDDFLKLIGSLHAAIWVFGQVILSLCEISDLAKDVLDISSIFQVTDEDMKNYGIDNEQLMDQINFESEISQNPTGNPIQLSSEHSHSPVLSAEDADDHIITSQLSSSSSENGNDSENSDDSSIAENMQNVVDENSSLPLLPSNSKLGSILGWYSPNEKLFPSNVVQLDKNNFVRFACISLFPTSKLLEKKTITDWLEIIKRLLPLANIVYCDANELLALKLCFEIIETLFAMNVAVNDYIIPIGDAIAESEGNIDSNNVCELLFNILQQLKSTGLKDVKTLERLFCSYIARCLMSNSANLEPLRFALEKVATGAMFTSELTHFSHILKFAVRIDLEENPDLYLDILCEQAEMEDSFATCFDECLTNLHTSNQNQMSVPILLIDILENFAMNLCSDSLIKIDSNSNEILINLSLAQTAADEGKLCLKFVIAIAFIRKFLKIYIEIMTSSDTECKATRLLSTHVNALLSKNKTCDFSALLSTELLHYLLRIVERKSGQENVEKFCRRIEPSLSNLTNVSWSSQKLGMSIIYNPLRLYTTDDWQMFCLEQMATIGQKDNKFQEILANANDNTMNLISVVAQRFYMNKCLKERTDSESEAASKISVLIEKSHLPYIAKTIISFLMGEKHFEHNVFELSVMIEAPVTQIVSIMITLASTISLLGNKFNLWHILLFDPNKLSNLCIPLIDVSSCSRNEVHHDLFQNMSSVCICVLQILLYSCLTSSLGFALASDSFIKQIVPNTDENIHQKLENQLQQYWKHLSSLLDLNYSDLCLVIHEIVFKSKDLFTGDAEICTKETEFDKLLLKHAEIIEQVMQNRITLKRKLNSLSYSTNDGSSSVEMCVTELCPCRYENVPFSNAVLLFRIPTSPTLKLLKTELQFQTNKTQYSLLNYVIENMDKFVLPQYVLSLIRWHLSVVTCASYKFRKVDFKDMTFNKFLAEVNDDKLRNKLKKDFNNLATDWNSIRSLDIELNSSDLMTRELELMHPTVKMEACCIVDSKSILLKVIKGLSNVQNSILEKAHSLLSNHNSLEGRFSKKQPKTVSLLDIKKTDLIVFEWDDKWLQFSQSDSGYGMAQNVIFDFKRIQQEIEAEGLVGKPLIEIPVLPAVMFTDDLFHNSVVLLKEIKSTIEQKRLPSDVKKTIEKKKDSDSSIITNLLTHVGMTLSLITKTTKTEVQPDMPIIEYLDKWKTVTGMSPPVFTQIFPEDSRLCHIVELYQWLEEINGDIVVESLDDIYRKPLLKDDKDMLLKAQTEMVKHLEKIEHPLKVFVHRNLSMKDNVIRTEQSLIDYISDEDFWWDGDLMEGHIVAGSQKQSLNNILSQSILVENIYETVQFVRKAVETAKQMDARITSITLSYQSTQQKEQPKRSSGRRIKRFMKS